MKIIIKILDYIISKKKQRLRDLEVQCTQENFKLEMLLAEKSRQQQSSNPKKAPSDDT